MFKLNVGNRKLIGLTISVVGIMMMYFGAAVLTSLAGLFVAGAGSIVTVYGTFCTANVMGEHRHKKEDIVSPTEEKVTK